MAASEAASDDYILGTDDIELDRLRVQHDLWRDTCHAHWDRTGWTDDHVIADIGCGPGFATVELAKRVGPSGRIIAIDRSKKYLAYLRSQVADLPIEVRRADAMSLELAPESLDGAYLRWILTFIKDVPAVCRQLFDAVRPGGTVAILDYLHWKGLTWGPRAKTIDDVRRGVLAMYADYEANFDVAQVIPKALVEAGFELVDLNPLTRIARPSDALWQWPEVWLRSFLPQVVEAGHLDATELAEWQIEWEANSKDPAGLFMTPPQLEIVARRPLATTDADR